MRPRDPKHTHTTLATVVVLTLLLVAGCGSDAEQTSAAVPDTSATPQRTAPATADGDTTAAPATPDRAEGIETVQADDAGEVDVRIAGTRLELVEVREADGWTHTVNSIDPDEIELDFHDDSGRVLRFEVELEDGRLKVETG